MYDPLIYGKNELERVVSIEVENDKTIAFIENEDGTINQGSSVIPTPGAPVTGSTTQTAGFTPINVIQDTQVASTEGTPPPINLQAGLNKFANGSFYWAAQGPSGLLEAVPVVLPICEPLK